MFKENLTFFIDDNSEDVYFSLSESSPSSKSNREIVIMTMLVAIKMILKTTIVNMVIDISDS